MPLAPTPPPPQTHSSTRMHLLMYGVVHLSVYVSMSQNSLALIMASNIIIAASRDLCNGLGRGLWSVDATSPSRWMSGVFLFA